jgi:hypothetical protein
MGMNKMMMILALMSFVQTAFAMPDDVKAALSKDVGSMAWQENSKRYVIGVDKSVRFAYPTLNGRPVFYGSFGGNTHRANLFCKLLGLNYSSDSFRAESHGCFMADMMDVQSDSQGGPKTVVTSRSIDGGFICHYFASITCK